MKKFRIGLLICAIIIIIAELFIMDYVNLFSSKNLGNSLTMVAMIIVIINLVFSFKNEKDKTEKIEN
jgi:hypothetical protein